MQDFTPEGFCRLIQLARQREYMLMGFGAYQTRLPEGRCVLLRHDICADIHGAVKLAHMEHELGVQATYFVMLTSPFYNPHASAERKAVAELAQLGHEIGLHFDENVSLADSFVGSVAREVALLEELAQAPVTAVSLHRPAAGRFNIEIPGLTLPYAYAPQFVSDMTYFSDSRRRWRQLGVIEQLTQDILPERVQLLLHPIWWTRNDGVATGWDAVQKWRAQQKESWIHTVQTHLDLYPPER